MRWISLLSVPFLAFVLYAEPHPEPFGAIGLQIGTRIGAVANKIAAVASKASAAASRVGSSAAKLRPITSVRASAGAGSKSSAVAAGGSRFNALIPSASGAFRQGFNRFNLLGGAAHRAVSSLRTLASRSRFRRIRRSDSAKDKVSLQQSAPPEMGAPPESKSRFQRAREAVSRGLGGASEIASQATGHAVQIQSLRLMQSMTDPQPGTSAAARAAAANSENSKDQSTEVSLKKSTSITGTCPVAVGNAFISANRQACPSVDADVPIDPDRSFSESDASVDDCSASDVDSKCTLSELKVGGSLHLRFRDYLNLRPYGHTQPVICRREIVAVSDRRPGYQQTLELISLGKSLGGDFVRFKRIALGCSAGRLPLSALDSPVKRQGPPAREVAEVPEVWEKGVTRLEWLGLLWDTVLVKNGCHLDGFLTYFLLKCKASPSYVGRNLLIPGDGPENILRELCALYVEFKPTAKVMPVKRTHQDWKKLWVTALYPEHGEALQKKKPVDFKGHESETIGEKLERSLVYFMTYQCVCGSSASDLAKARKVFVPSYTIEELKIISREKSSAYGTSLNARLSFLNPHSCSPECKKAPLATYIFVPTTTWFLYFYVGKEERTSPLQVTDFPKKVVVHELFHQGTAEFVLGYITAASTISPKRKGLPAHQTSFVYFNQKFYYYDDASDKGALILCVDPNASLAAKKLKLVSATYFRS